MPPSHKCLRLINIHKAQQLLAPVQNRRDLVLGPWSSLADGRNFVLVDDGADDRILVFGTPQNLTRVCNSQAIFMDGTLITFYHLTIVLWI